LLVIAKGRGWRDNNQGKKEQSNAKEIINKDNKKGV
jgi:hypothetical protein